MIPALAFMILAYTIARLLILPAQVGGESGSSRRAWTILTSILGIIGIVLGFIILLASSGGGGGSTPAPAGNP